MNYVYMYVFVNLKVGLYTSPLTDYISSSEAEGLRQKKKALREIKILFIIFYEAIK